MIKYDRKIEFQTLDSSIIDKINNYCNYYPNQKILIEIPNTKGVSSDLIKRLNPSVLIRIAGAYDKEKVNRFGKVKYPKETGQYYTDAVIYSKNEVIRIISEMEKIEKFFEGQNFSQFEKLVYIYGFLKSHIMYDPKYEEKLSAEIRSLRGFLTKQTVCAGYAVMLKEILDRQGIQCYYVQGKSPNGGHAWNIVRLNGKNYPIDLTWDNTKFRSGDMGTYDFLGQDVVNFQKNHIPDDKDPCRYLRLSEINKEEVKKIARRMAREKDYNSTTYRGEREDGSKFLVSHVGHSQRKGKNYYRYFYSDISEDGKYNNQMILYSRSNITNYIDAKRFGRKMPENYGEKMCNLLFSKENIANSLNRGTRYIGCVTKLNKDNKKEFVNSVSEIVKEDDEIKMFNSPIRRYTRLDGTTFVVEPLQRNINANGIPVNYYQVLELVNKTGNKTVKGNIIYTEMDLFKDNRIGIANDFLSRDRLDRKAKETGGYIGFYDETGVRRYNPKLVHYFRSSESSAVKKRRIEDDMQAAQKRVQWIKSFIKDYKYTESADKYRERKEYEEQEIQAVIQCIKRGKSFSYNGKNLDEYRNHLDVIIPIFARLLIAADNITIDGGMNYIDQFISIPEISDFLGQIARSNEYAQIHSYAEYARKNNKATYWGNTRAEIDKMYAQEYLESNKMSQRTVEDEILYRRGLLRHDRIKVSDERDIRNVPKIRKQQISLTRVLARQMEKIPGEIKWDSKIGLYFESDIQQRKGINSNESQLPASDTIDGYNISLSDIEESVLNANINIQDIRKEEQELRKATKTNDIEQFK